MEYKKLRLKDLEYEIDGKIVLKDILTNSLLKTKYLSLLGIKHISNLDDYEVITSNLENDIKYIFLENKMVLLRNKISKNILLGVSDFKQDMNIFNKIDFDEIVFLDENIINNIFNTILLSSKEEYKYKQVSTYKLNFKIYKLFIKNSKPFDKLPLYFNKKSAIFYISDFMSYLYINKKIYEIKIEEKNLVNDINKHMSIIKYLFNYEDDLIIINNTDLINIKNMLDIKSFNFKISYIDKKNFTKIYNGI